MSLFPPDHSAWVHAHCDGGSRGNPGPSGYGAVITDGAGQTLAELSEFLGARTNNYAEYSGLLAVLKWALEQGHRRVKLVSDSELMVKQIQGKYKVNSPDLKPLWQLARERIGQLDAFEISHALRHKNKAADALANEAMDRGMSRTAAPRAAGASAPAGRAAMTQSPASPAAAGPARDAKPALPAMLRGFTRNGSIHLLGSTSLPDGIFVKVIPE